MGLGTPPWEGAANGRERMSVPAWAGGASVRRTLIPSLGMAPPSLGPAHTLLRHPSARCTHNPRPSGPPPPPRLPGGGQEDAGMLAAFLHIPPAKELPPAFRSINNEPGTREKKKSEPQSKCQESKAPSFCISSALASGDRLSPSVLEMKRLLILSGPDDVLRPHGASETLPLLI